MTTSERPLFYTNFQEAREVRRPHEKTIPKVTLHPLGAKNGPQNFMTSLRTAPDRQENLRPWSDDAMNDDKQLLREAFTRGVIVDTFTEQLVDRVKSAKKRDYFDKHPEKLEQYLKTFDKPEFMIIAEFPWKEGKGMYIPILGKKAFEETIYSRNDPIYTKEEQEYLGTITTAHAGMGVGGSLAKGLVKAGVTNLRIADGGALNLHDENRVTDADVATILDNHAVDWAIKAYQRNPHLKIDCYAQNIADGENDTVNRSLFMDGVDYLFEEVDDIREKVLLRMEAKRKGITVIMATDVGEGTVIDIQRPEDDIFPGLTEDDWEILDENRKLTFKEASDMATKIIGPQYIKNDYINKAEDEGRSYWAQTGSSADASSAAVVQTVLALHREKKGGPKVPRQKAYMVEDLDAA